MKKYKAKKLYMSQIFNEFGDVVPVTWIELNISDDIDLKEGESVKVSGTSKGKGFQGVVKRHGFAGGSRTHGQKHSEREPGSIGGGGRAGGRVIKGMRMAGRMGGKRATVRNLKIVRMIPEEKLMALRGAVPGPSRGSIEIYR